MNYPHKCDVYNVAYNKDPYLGTEKTKNISNSNVKCWIQPEDVEEHLLQERESQEITHVMYCPVIDIELTDQIQVTTDPYQDIWYDIVSVKNEAGISHHLKVELKKVT